jgi:hypothetical protein
MGESRIDPEAGEEGLGGMLVSPPETLTSIPRITG